MNFIYVELTAFQPNKIPHLHKCIWNLMSCFTQAAIFWQYFHTQTAALLWTEKDKEVGWKTWIDKLRDKKWLFFPSCSLNDCFLQQTEGGELLIISRIHLQDRVRGGCHGNWQMQQWTKWSPFGRSETMKKLVLSSPRSSPPPSSSFVIFAALIKHADNSGKTTFSVSSLWRLDVQEEKMKISSMWVEQKGGNTWGRTRDYYFLII